tara:strand:- start:331 stop:549 length:219 start_codon:yes stop_codon:yes gene_type:complete
VSAGDLKRNFWRIFVRLFLNIIVLSFSLIIISCEDDPLLAPSAPEEDKGSYAKLSLPGSSDRSDQRDNPEIY